MTRNQSGGSWAGAPSSFSWTVEPKAAPLTARGARTRAALVQAARRIFERDGFIGARLTDIPADANVSTGTFYTYFDSKEEVFAAVVEEAQNDILHPGMPHVANNEDPRAVIAASNLAYLTAYQRNAKLMLLLNQVAAIDPQFWELRAKRGRLMVERNAAAIGRLQTRGLVDANLDPLLASRALSAMVARMALDYLAREQTNTVEEIAEVVTTLWINGLGLQSRAEPSHPSS